MCIIALQGIVLYRQLLANVFSRRFEPGKRHQVIIYSVGYGLPAILVTALLITDILDPDSNRYIRFSDTPDGNAEPTTCWIEPESLLWAFVGPVAFVLLMNIVITIIILKTAAQAALRSR